MPRAGRLATASPVRAFSAVLALLAALLGVGAASPPAALAAGSGGIGIRLVDAPVATRDDPRARTYIVDHLRPGTTIRRRVEVANTTNSARTISVYAAAASLHDGSFLGATGRTQNDLTTWTSVSPGEPVVPAGGKAMSTVTIAVPRDAPPGEQYGVVWAETRSAPQAGANVLQVSRVGIRLYVSVGPGGAPAADFTIDSLTASRTGDGRPVVTASVHNTGGRALDMSGSLDLTSGPGGLRAGPFPASLGVTLGISDTEPVTVTLDKAVPAGPWTATITLRSGLVQRAASATLTFPDSGTGTAVATTAEDRPIRLYLTAAAAVTAAGLLLGFVLLRVRRRG